MALETYAYGSVEGVAVYSRRFTNKSSQFDDSTYPTFDTVETWINEVSAMMNLVLNTNNITTPITDAELVSMLDLFINQEVAAMANGVNGAGRLGPTSRTVKNAGMLGVVRMDIEKFVSQNALGFDRMGATRSSIVSEILTRDTDEDGDETFPLFSRDSFGGETFKEGN